MPPHDPFDFSGLEPATPAEWPSPWLGFQERSPAHDVARAREPEQGQEVAARTVGVSTTVANSSCQAAQGGVW